MNEDQLIAEAFVMLRAAILDGDWVKVCSAYEIISGERLEPPNQKVKTRLEKIREMMNVETQTEDESNEIEDSEPQATSVESMTAKELKDYLVKTGINPKNLKGKNKTELLKMAVTANPFEPTVNEIKETEIEGGKKFGLGKVKIISDGFDPIEAELNKLASKRKTNIVTREPKVIEDTSDDDTAQHRFHSKPKMAPPWR
jgi:hypothetical protein